jgi:DNA repair protein RecN (Recombination protein N)
VSVAPLGDEGGAHGADRVEFDAETNPGAGFGPLRKIASGGELARVSLALKCALAEAGSAGTLIFDEADQGVGGAVAAAIGERLIRLGRTRQVFAITHSPQVAAAARSQWLVEKGRGKSGGTRLRGLDESDRQEEIARMLSGAEITEEARAAAGRLLEDV